MSFRITDREQLAGMPSNFQRQVSALHGAALPARGKRTYHEEAEGRRLVQWIDTLVVDHPPHGRIRVADYFAHVPNGGARNATEGAILKGQGVRPGWPDYDLRIPRGPWLGAVGELKRVDGAKPDDQQLDILTRLHAIGYRAMVWFGFDDAQKQILGYLQLGPHFCPGPRSTKPRESRR